MTVKKQIEILIADDFKVLRDIIRLYLEREDDMDVIGEAPELDYALELAKSLRPDVIIMNDYLPPVDSALAASLFRQEGVPAVILAISMTVEPELIRRSLEHGVDGFIHKDEIDLFMVHAIRCIYRGERYLSPKAQQSFDSNQK